MQILLAGIKELHVGEEIRCQSVGSEENIRLMQMHGFNVDSQWNGVYLLYTRVVTSEDL